MNAPWVADMRHFAQLDAEEAADYARERLAAEIAADPCGLATAIGDRDGADKTLISLCLALSAIYTAGQQATPEQSMALCLAVQAIADDAASYELEC